MSYADTEVFEALLKQTGLDMAVDVAICSQQAQSCKPDAKIFRDALTLAGASAATTMFVGDSIEYDIVGANRIGMRSALVPAGEMSRSDPTNHDPMTAPDHHLTTVRDIPELLQRCLARH